jgi:hypothetical protein
MTKYNEDPLLWIFESTQDQAQFAAIHECNAKKKAKQEKENAENAHHKILLTQPSPLSTSPGNTTTKPNQTQIQIQCHPTPPSPPLSTGPIKDSPGIWSVSYQTTP